MEPFRVPLFPLPVVLFPGTVVPLHIFEPRYQQMVSDVLKGEKSFGLLYHDPEGTGPFAGGEGQIGTVAEILRHQPFPNGRAMILVRGAERFQIQADVTGDALYHEAMVKMYDDEPKADFQRLVARRKRSLALFKNILQTLPHVPEALPSFSVKRELSFRLAAVVRMDPFWQQELLELQDEVARLDRLDPVFQAGVERWWEHRGNEA